MRRTETVSFNSDTSLRLIAESLGLVDRLGAEPINVRSVRMADRTLVVEIVVPSADPIAVRGDIAGVMGALSGLDVPSLFPVLGAQSFGVRAYDSAGAELLWIVSSLEAAAFVARGQPIEWLARSWLQENTPAYRRSQADRVIGQVETALRDLVDLHATEHVGEEYLDHLWNEREVADLRDRAVAEGQPTDDSRGLLDFTFLPQLRDAITAHAEWMDDGCIPDPASFRQTMRNLNRVRRKVAHHRPVGEDDLVTCSEAAQAVFGPAGRTHPELAADFQVDRWEEQVAAVFESAMRQVQSPTVPERGSASERERRAAAAGALKTQLTGLEGALASMDRLVVPPQRSELHRRAVDALSQWIAGLRQLIAVAVDPDLTVADAEVAKRNYEQVLETVRELRREIQRLRVLGPLSESPTTL